MNLIQKFYNNFRHYGPNKAFVINNEAYTYAQFFSLVNGSRLLLECQPGFSPQKPVGVFCNEQAETYAAVFAIWFSGGTFVPLNPSFPPPVNAELIEKHNLQVIISPGELPDGLEMKGIQILANMQITSVECPPLFNWLPEHTLYVLNTSGSTGTPKAVPISLKNVEAFVEGFLERYPELNEKDTFLQTYELTADAAFTGYLIPFLLGATVYSTPVGGFKPFTVAKIITEKPITWVQVTPSLLACLRPFFKSFHLKEIKHFHFGGEALPADLVDEWRQHIPNAEISNVYGPTETTITATIYKCTPKEKIRARKNMVSIGFPLKRVRIDIQHDQNSERSELLIAGDQVMKNYLFSSNQPFKVLSSDKNFYYPSGDFVEKDDDGFLYFIGRKDEQVKISGYRVDLTEVENQVRMLLPGVGNIAAAAIEKSSGMFRLVVFIEKYTGTGKEIIDQLIHILPSYKVPETIIGIDSIPLSPSGKTDKKSLVINYLNAQK